MTLPAMRTAFEADINAVAEECISELLCNGVLIAGMAGGERSSALPGIPGMMPEKTIEFIAAKSLFTGGLPKKPDILVLDGIRRQVESVEESADGSQVRINFEAIGA